MKLKKFGEMEPKEKKVKKEKTGGKGNAFASVLSKVKGKKAAAEPAAEPVAEPSAKAGKGKALAAKIKDNKFAMGIVTKLMKKEDGNAEGTDKQKKQSALFSIRNKIFVCFLVPIVFMVIVAIFA